MGMNYLELCRARQANIKVILPVKNSVAVIVKLSEVVDFAGWTKVQSIPYVPLILLVVYSDQTKVSERYFSWN